jgi:hypothetical protein
VRTTTLCASMDILGSHQSQSCMRQLCACHVRVRLASGAFMQFKTLSVCVGVLHL